MTQAGASVAEVRACQNEVEQPDLTAPLCPGTLTFRVGDLQAKCDTCGGWEGVNALRSGTPGEADHG